MLTPAQIDLIKGTVPVLQAHGVELTKHFYARMLTRNPELRNLFNHTHQVHGAQQKALAAAILAYAANIDHLERLEGAVKQIAQRHCSLGVHAEQYAVVGENLLASIKEVLGEAATPELIEAWRVAYEQLSGILIHAEQEIYAKQEAKEGGWSGWRSFQCVNRVKECSDVESFYFIPSDFGPVPTYKAGQYTTIRIHSKALNLTQPRQYTLSQAPTGSMLRVTVKAIHSDAGHPDGLVSNHLHTLVHVGDEVELSAPTGTFVLDDVKAESPLVFIAAGIGITPIVPMLEELATENPLRPVHFLYSTQNSAHYPLRKDVEAALKGMPNAGKGVYFTNPGPDDHLGADFDVEGRITVDKIRSFCQHPDADFYICGPIDFMKDMSNALQQIGVLPGRIHTETFSTGGLE